VLNNNSSKIICTSAYLHICTLITSKPIIAYYGY
jgi:hypothetical protein